MVKRLFINPQTRSATAKDWHAVNWQLVHYKVVRLQFAIAKAVREGKWRKVRCLQGKLVHSFYAKLLAVRRVTENRGKKTSGIDRELWSTPEAKLKAAKRLNDHNYRAKPLRRVWIPKRNGKLRPLGIPTMHDRAMQALYLLALEPVAETMADHHSYGFRPKRSTQDAIRYTHNLLSQGRSNRWILEADNRPLDWSFFNPLAFHLEVEQNNRSNALGNRENASLFLHLDKYLSGHFRVSGSVIIDEIKLERSEVKNNPDM